MAKALEALAGLRKRDLLKFLNTDKRVREWLRDGAVMGTVAASKLMGVDRQRIWRWQEEGKIENVGTEKAALYMRADLERMLREDPPKRRARRNGDRP